MTEFTPDRLAELKAVAEAATEGAWEYDPKILGLPNTTVMAGDSQLGYVSVGTFLEPNATHIAAFDPPTVAALIAALEAKTAEVERWKLGTDCPICAKEYPQYPYTDEHLAGWQAAFKWVHHAHERRDGSIDGNGVLGATPDCIVVDEDWMNEQFWQRDARAVRAEAAIERVSRQEFAGRIEACIPREHRGYGTAEEIAALIRNTIHETGADDE